jgi:Protein of unknown function (DUF2608)
MLDVRKKIDVLLLEHTAKDCLVAFDIDMTLLQPDHPAVYYPNLRKHVDAYKAIMKTLSPAERDRKATLTVQILPQRLVEEDTPAIVHEIQAKGVPTLAFTASLCGPLLYTTAKITSLATHIEALRFEILGRFDFHFESVFKTDPIVFDEIPAHNHQHPIFFEGILCANGEQGKESDKGVVLVAFMKRLQLSPKVVVLVDDRMPNLEAVDRALKHYDPSIEFLGIEYQGAFEYAPESISEEAFRAFWEDFASQAKITLQEQNP